MANEIAIDLSQDVPNQLTAIADMERAKLIPKTIIMEWVILIHQQIKMLWQMVTDSEEVQVYF